MNGPPQNPMIGPRGPELAAHEADRLLEEAGLLLGIEGLEALDVGARADGWIDPRPRSLRERDVEPHRGERHEDVARR